MIGVFDSGVGGLSVWKELVSLMPDQKYIYVSDSGYCPYGPKPKSYIIDRALKISEFLISQGVDLIVVACNTATAAAIEVLRSSFEIPFVGMEPAVKPAALQTRSGVIGVLATQGTFRGELYLSTLHKFASNTKVIEQIGTGLVELVEDGMTDTPQARQLIAKYVEPMVGMGADHIVLGCTHYPFLAGVIKDVAGDDVTIVNPAPAIARHTVSLLESQGKLVDSASGDNVFYTTGSNAALLESMVNEIVNLRTDGNSCTDCEKRVVRSNRFCAIGI